MSLFWNFLGMNGMHSVLTITPGLTKETSIALENGISSHLLSSTTFMDSRARHTNKIQVIYAQPTFNAYAGRRKKRIWQNSRTSMLSEPVITKHSTTYHLQDWMGLIQQHYRPFLMKTKGEEGMGKICYFIPKKKKKCKQEIQQTKTN